MKKRFLTLYSLMAITALMTTGCKNDWTIDEANVPPIQEKAAGFGYADGFRDGGSLLFAVNAEKAGEYEIAVTGRAINKGEEGTGVIFAGSSRVPLTFTTAGSWQTVTVKLQLQAGSNDVEISGDGGNGAFQIDYIELK